MNACGTRSNTVRAATRGAKTNVQPLLRSAKLRCGWRVSPRRRFACCTPDASVRRRAVRHRAPVREARIISRRVANPAQRRDRDPANVAMSMTTPPRDEHDASGTRPHRTHRMGCRNFVVSPDLTKCSENGPRRNRMPRLSPAVVTPVIARSGITVVGSPGASESIRCRVHRSAPAMTRGRTSICRLSVVWRVRASGPDDREPRSTYVAKRQNRWVELCRSQSGRGTRTPIKYAHGRCPPTQMSISMSTSFKSSAVHTRATVGKSPRERV
jgi:hypothetical protein